MGLTRVGENVARRMSRRQPGVKIFTSEIGRLSEQEPRIIARSLTEVAQRNTASWSFGGVQCDIRTGAVIERRMLRVTPPSTNSRNRE
jgi:hypothetical protein